MSPTLPGTAVQLHSHADRGWHLGDRDEPDIAGDGWRVKVIDDWGVGIFVALHHLLKIRHCLCVYIFGLLIELD